MSLADFIEQAIEDAEQHGAERMASVSAFKRTVRLAGDCPDHEIELAELSELARLLWSRLGPAERAWVRDNWDPMGEKESTKAKAAGWERLPKVEIPACDLCPRPAAWRHPAGGLRCLVCPKPEETKSEKSRRTTR